MTEAIETGRALLSDPLPSDIAVLYAIGAAAQTMIWAGRPMEGLRLYDSRRDEVLMGLQQVPFAPVGDAVFRGTQALLSGHIGEGVALTLRAYEESLGRDSVWVRGFLAGLAGALAVAQGRPETATRLLKESTSLLIENDLLRHRSIWLATLAHARALVRDAEGATAALSASGSVRRNVVSDMVFRGQALVWSAVSRGEVSRAIEIALEEAERMGSLSVTSTQTVLLHDVVRLGQPERVVDELAAVAAECDGRLIPAFARHARVLVDRDAAGLEGVSREFEEMGAFLLAAEAAAEASRAHRTAGRSGSALAAAARARSLMELCEGARTPALEGIEEPLPLTRREREVATLAARGLSTKDIADRLVVSVRTVENHLHSVYAKLGIAGRDELAPILEPVTGSPSA